jgi:hypothetical protein
MVCDCAMRRPQAVAAAYGIATVGRAQSRDPLVDAVTGR